MKENRKEELIERYLYDVVKRLPEKQRKDIEEELRTLIEDMIAEREENPAMTQEECAKAVLNELGNPAKLARSYRGEHDSLISGEYYDNYCFVLKIVLICAGVGILISNIVSAVIHVVELEGITSEVWSDMVNIGAIPMAMIFAFGAVTLIFAGMERYQVSMNEQAWSLDKLPQIPYKKAVISRGESAAGIIFGVLVLVLFTFAPQLLGAWIQRDGVFVTIPIFNLTIWRSVLPLFIAAALAGIMTDFVKLAAGRHNYTVMTVTIIMDVISFGLTFFLFASFPIWNPDFIPELEKALGTAFTSKQDILHYFGQDIFTKGFLGILLFAFLLDIGTTVYYTVKYSKE